MHHRVQLVIPSPLPVFLSQHCSVHEMLSQYLRMKCLPSTCFSLQLPKIFPGLLMNLQAYAREVPMFSFQPGAVKLDLQCAVKAFAIQPNGTQTPLFKLNVVSTSGISTHTRMNACKCLLCFSLF